MIYYSLMSMRIILKKKIFPFLVKSVFLWKMSCRAKRLAVFGHQNRLCCCFLLIYGRLKKYGFERSQTTQKISLKHESILHFPFFLGIFFRNSKLQFFSDCVATLALDIPNHLVNLLLTPPVLKVKKSSNYLLKEFR